MSHLSPYGNQQHDELLAPSPTPTHTVDQSGAAGARDPNKKHEPSSSFMKDLNLVAEAARRAQNALLARDFENCAIDKR